MARDVDKRFENARSPEDVDGFKVSVKYIFNPDTREFYPDSGGFYSGVPTIHRNNVTEKDTEFPSVDAGVNCIGYKHCRFDVRVGGKNITSLRVGIVRWNSTVSSWFYCGSALDLTDSECFTISGGDVCLIEDEAFGATIFLKVFDFVGDNFCLNSWSVLC